MAYDSDRGVTVFFGGEIGKTGSETYFNDTWEYDGSHWRQITIVGDIPPARSLHAMAYDPVRKVVLMYGGFGTAVPGGGGVYGFDDTWAYQGNGFSGTWTHVAGNASDHGNAGPGLVWAQFQSEIIRVGGIDRPYYAPSGVFNVFGGAYYWTGVWTDDRNPGPLIWGFGLAYDSYRNVAVLVGGYGTTFDVSNIAIPNDVWEFRFNIGWTNTTTTTSIASSFAGRGFPAMAYDERRHRMVVVGGDNGQAGTGEQTYELDSLHPENGWMLGVSLPLGRAGAAMVYDSKRGVMVLMGGAGPGAPNSTDGGRYDDTWELVPAPPAPVLAGPEVTNIFCVNEPFSGLRVYSSGSLALFTYQWAVDGVPFPDQTNYSLQLPRSVLAAGTHTFTVTATDQCGNPISTNATYTFHQAPVIGEVTTANYLALLPDPGSFLLTYYQCPGASVTFTANMVIDALSLPTTYQWYKNGIALQGETNVSLSLPNVRHEDSGGYEVVASNVCGSTDSAQTSPVYLQVGVTIDNQPVDAIVQVCHTTNFSVQAHGFGPLQYQWRMDGIPLTNDEHFSGVSSSNLTVSRVLYAHEHDYDVVITDNCGAANAVTSRVAQLSITPGPQWVLRTTNGPSARYGNAMAYDSDRGVTVMYGGGQLVANIGYVGVGEVWEWNGAHWRQRTTYNTNAAWKPIPGNSWLPAYGDTPVGRMQHAMAYDSRRHRTVMFGGRTAGPAGGDYILSDTWEWDGLRWYFRTTNGPPVRFDHHMAYDANRGVVVLFGGFGVSHVPVWEWNGTNWTPVTATNGPATYAYDQTEGSMDFEGSLGQVFYGPANNGSNLRYYWSWDGNTWIDRGSGLGVSTDSPPHGALAFDTYRKRSILFGGQDNGFNAAYGGSTLAYFNPRHSWTEMRNAAQISMFVPQDFLDPFGLRTKLVIHSDPVSQFLWTNFSSTAQADLGDPTALPGAQAVTLSAAFNGIIGGGSIYDATRFGGVSLSTETILFQAINPVGTDVVRYNRLLLEDAYSLQIRRGPSIPTGRARHAMSFDSARNAAVLMGGLYGAGTVGNETWELLDVDLPLINEQPSSQYRAPGDTAVFSISAVGPFGTGLSYDWFYGAVPLNDGGRISGAHSATMSIANVSASDAGQYQVRISNDCGTIYSVPAVLTTNPGLQIFSSANAVTLTWSAANVVLQQADSLAGPWTVVAGATSPFDVAAAVGPAKFFRLVPTGP
jgi:hypothetical protein